MTMSFSRIAIGSVLTLSLLIGLHGCGKDPETVLPEGVQTMTGVLVPAPLSRVRRGTHTLNVQGEKIYYVESGKTDLRDFEGVDVVVTGTLELNDDRRDLPVLVASGVTLVDMPSIAWTLDALKVSLETPENWDRKVFDDGVQFVLTGSTTALLRIYPSTMTQLPTGSMLQVAGRRGVRTGTGGQIVHVQNGREIVTFNFTPDSSMSPQQAEKAFTRILRSVRFGQHASAAASAGMSVKTETGGSVPSGQPCGGPAGVLCPQGQYCEVTDTATNIGRCRSLKR